ncbi:MAG TPA: hypothetical protein VEU33_01970, partial [Archangium sp.]|nr:hypothetical protein [Archangium sp.]
MNKSFVARNWAIAITISLFVGCGPEDFEQKQAQAPNQFSFSAQKISGGTEVQLPAALTTTATPSIVTLGMKTYVFYRSSSDSGIYMLRANGYIGNEQWDGLFRLPGFVNTSDAPSAVTLDNKIYVFYKGAHDDTRIFVARSLDGGLNWRMAMLPDNNRTRTRPEAHVIGGSIYLLYADVAVPPYDPAGKIVMGLLADGDWTDGHWTDGEIVSFVQTPTPSALTGFRSFFSPAMVSLNGARYVFLACAVPEDQHSTYRRIAIFRSSGSPFAPVWSS